MTLRGRLTLFYTALLAALLTVVAVATLALMRNNLVLGIDRDLVDKYRQFTSFFRLLDLPPLGEAGSEDGAEADVPPQLSIARYLFPNVAIQFEELPFYDAETLVQGLAAADTAAKRRQFFASLRQLANSTRRRPIGLDPGAPITLSDEEWSRLIRAPEQRLFVTRQVQEPFQPVGTAVPMRFLVVLGPVQDDGGVPGLTRESFALTYVGRDLRPLNDTLTQLQRVLLGLFLVGLLTAGVGAYLLAGRALRPLRQVQRAAERIGGQNLGERVPEPQTGDEVQALAQALNAMLGRLEASFEAQRRFTSDASHELRTPVTAISGHASYLLRRSNPTEQQRESLNIIRREAERLTNLIASLLELARSDSGALTLTRQPILSRPFLEEITRELAPLAQAQGTELVAGGEDVTFEGDHDRLKQVLINLVSNALKAGARRVILTSSPQAQGREIRLSVQDDGPGIPPEHLARLFDRFYRVEDSRSRDQGGAGLGLSIAKGIVDAHGGRIWLESEVGRGTTANVQLPVGNVPALDDDVP
ncbi:cell wall metabolism sensor histidine kinase WalK [Deinococcus sp. YIM 77859]|uniref:sensor histidine kinase n=1 Tax=Deinococcus sp. YIM 77859 TaxID=1540221 RepID=UPI000552214E|nr:HAMP domain-containing sensor histidine kinase [Deinococcus sp. YIM 77859]